MEFWCVYNSKGQWQAIANELKVIIPLKKIVEIVIKSNSKTVTFDWRWVQCEKINWVWHDCDFLFILFLILNETSRHSMKLMIQPWMILVINGMSQIKMLMAILLIWSVFVRNRFEWVFSSNLH